MPQLEEIEGAETGEVRKIPFETAEQARNYLQWKREVPDQFRGLVEACMIGKPFRVDKAAQPLVQDFLVGTGHLLHDPNQLTEILEGDELVKKQLKKLQSVQAKDDSQVNVFELLRAPEIGFDQKLQWYRAQIEPRLKWLMGRKVLPAKETEFLPPSDLDTLDPAMDEMEKGKEEPSSCFYEIAPFYGGYYRGRVYEHFDGTSLQWKKASKQVQQLASEIPLIESTKRTVVGKFTYGKAQFVDLPYGFVIDPESITKNDDFSTVVRRGTDGVFYVEVRAKNAGEIKTEIDLEFSIGKPKEQLEYLESVPVVVVETPARLPNDLSQKILDAKNSFVDEITKARILCGFVRGHLEYSNESRYNDIYKHNPVEYFELMWQHKKADCDVANTLAAETLRQAGIGVRMVVGHYVKSPTKAGTALLHGGTVHAWLEVYDPQNQTWVRMDATPKGDPNMDEEEQEKDLDQNNEGDYGEQEAEIMSDEDLQELIKKLEQEEREQEAARRTPENIFAQEAGCTPQEAKCVLEKIRKLRELKDAKGNNVLQQSQEAWGQVLRKNMRERTVYTGPVTMREGTDLVDPVSAWIDLKTHIDNPTGFERPEKRIEIEKAFGGFEVYIAADMSGSMNDIDPVSRQRKADAQRDSVFLFVDSVMSNAINARIYEKKLKNPMPVKVCVSVFGARTEIVLPLTTSWGAREQIILYRALDHGAGGRTPDDKALDMLKEQMTIACQEEEQLRQQLNSTQAKTWKMNRFVAVFADGESNDAGAVHRKVKAMREDGNVVFGFGVTESGRAMEAVYAPDVKIIPDASKLAEMGIQTLVETIKKWYTA